MDPLNPNSASCFGPLKAPWDGTRKRRGLPALCDWCAQPGAGSRGKAASCLVTTDTHEWEAQGPQKKRAARILRRSLPGFKFLFASVGCPQGPTISPGLRFLPTGVLPHAGGRGRKRSWRARCCSTHPFPVQRPWGILLRELSTDLPWPICSRAPFRWRETVATWVALQYDLSGRESVAEIVRRYGLIPPFGGWGTDTAFIPYINLPGGGTEA